MRRQLGIQIVELYETLLSYQITFVCSCYRHRGPAFLGDILELDDWEHKMKLVVDAETDIYKSSRKYTALQMSLPFEQPVVNRVTDEENQCLRNLRSTDPRDDKDRMKKTKGGLLIESYAWIVGNQQFQQWRTHPGRRVLWIKGNPGKGKTMLLCGMINELSRLNTGNGKGTCLAYFLCQATDSRISGATSVLRGLIYLLIEQNPSLISYIREKYDLLGKICLKTSMLGLPFHSLLPPGILSM